MLKAGDKITISTYSVESGDSADIEGTVSTVSEVKGGFWLTISYAFGELKIMFMDDHS